MEKIDALRRVKQAEEEARKIREEGARHAAQLVKDASASAARTVEEARRQAEAEFARGLTEAQREVAREREVIVARGREAAQAIESRRGSKAFEKAAELILERFEKRVS